MPIMERPNSRTKKIFHSVMERAQNYGDEAEFFDKNIQETLPSGKKVKENEESLFKPPKR
jgi:hypothetical protein